MTDVSQLQSFQKIITNNLDRWQIFTSESKLFDPSVYLYIYILLKAHNIFTLHSYFKAIQSVQKSV